MEKTMKKEAIDLSKYENGFQKIEADMKYTQKSLDESKSEFKALYEAKKKLTEEYSKKLSETSTLTDEIRRSLEKGDTTGLANYARNIPVFGRIVKAFSRGPNVTIQELMNLSITGLQSLDKEYSVLLAKAHEKKNSSDAYINQLFESQRKAIGMRKSIENDVMKQSEYVTELEKSLETADDEMLVDINQEIMKQKEVLGNLEFSKYSTDKGIKRFSDLVKIEREVMSDLYRLTVDETRKTKEDIRNQIEALGPFFSRFQTVLDMVEKSHEGLKMYIDLGEMTNQVALLTSQMVKSQADLREAATKEPYLTNDTIEGMKENISEIEKVNKANADTLSKETDEIIKGKKKQTT